MYRARLLLGLAGLALALLVGPAPAADREVVDIERSRPAECQPTSVTREWPPLKEDGLHNPDSRAVSVLQAPEQALKPLPSDYAGNQVDWVEALQTGSIGPRARSDGTEVDVRIRDTNIIMRNTGSAKAVLFPHKPHTEWLACANCHDDPFKKEAGATQFTMMGILQGRYCGRCHGAVAFPLTECNRCHSVTEKGKLVEFCEEALP